jgi:peptidoglycan/LPS O-acetylase OafA/YrhL
MFHGRGSLPLHTFSQAYLAVDFFFMLSGFVIGYAYERNLISGALSKGRFLLLRAIRLYPMIALGSVIGLVLFGVRMSWVGNVETTQHPFAAAVLGAVAIPSPSLIAEEPFPLNGPTWSLACEIGINLLYLFLARWLRTPVVIAITICAFAAEAYYFWHFGSIAHVGATEGPLWAIAARTAFPFFAGLLIYRTGLHRVSSPGNALPVALAVFLALVMAVPNVGRFNTAMEIICIFGLFPAIVALGSIRQPTGWVVKLAEKSSDISYPLYALHQPLVRTLYTSPVFLALGWRTKQVVFLAVAGACIVAALLVAPRDEAFRLRLRSLLLPRRAAKQA